jgi:Trypsin
MSQFRAVLTGLMLLALPLAAQDANTGLDNTGLDRLTRRDQLLGWEAVGRIDIAGGGFCTGTLIATDLVLTAGHCVKDRDGTPIDASLMTFRAGLSDGTAIAEAKVARTVAHPDYTGAWPAPLEQLRLDVALLQLQTAIPRRAGRPVHGGQSRHGGKGQRGVLCRGPGGGAVVAEGLHGSGAGGRVDRGGLRCDVRGIRRAGAGPVVWSGEDRVDHLLRLPRGGSDSGAGHGVAGHRQPVEGGTAPGRRVKRG